MALVPVVGNPQLSHTSLLQPGVVPPQIGTFTFNTLNTTVFDVGTLIPNTAQQLSVNISIHCGHASQQSIFNVWVWTELEGGRQDINLYKVCATRKVRTQANQRHSILLIRRNIPDSISSQTLTKARICG